VAGEVLREFDAEGMRVTALVVRGEHGSNQLA
jgi:hypothetical protein